MLLDCVLAVSLSCLENRLSIPHLSADMKPEEKVGFVMGGLIIDVVITQVPQYVCLAAC